MSFTSAGVRVWDATEAASVHGASAAQGDSINRKIVTSYATTTARDAAYAGYTSAEKAGIICHVVNRDGHCYWSLRDAAWKWISVARVIANQDQGVGTGAGAGSLTVNHGSGYEAIQAIQAVLLPGGNRLVRVEYSVNANNLGNGTGDTFPRISVSGNGMGAVGATNTLIQGYMPDQGSTMITMCKVWQYVLSGVLDINVYGTQAKATSRDVAYSYGRLDVTDLGPTDA